MTNMRKSIMPNERLIFSYPFGAGVMLYQFVIEFEACVIMVTNFALSAYLICIGLAAAGAGAHLYQLVFREPAMLRYDGKTYAGTLGHVFMSFVCGPFIMLKLGWQRSSGGDLSKSNLLLAALLAFGWSFFTGMLLLSSYLRVIG